MIVERKRKPEQTALAAVLAQAQISTCRELSRRTGWSAQRANNLWHARIGLGGKAALELAEATGLPAEVFLRIGKAWRDQHPSVKRKAG